MDVEQSNKKYGAILADPPWAFKTYSDLGLGRSAEAHYDTMPLEDILKIPVTNWAADDCALFLWTTDTHLPQALKLIEAWGFEYKTVGFYWAKLNQDLKTFYMGMGHWTRSNPEQCLLATRGHPQRLDAGVRKLITAPRREHSRKPDEVRSYIERLVPGPYLEMFARESKENWDCFGNQTSLFSEDKKEIVKTRRIKSNLKENKVKTFSVIDLF